MLRLNSITIIKEQTTRFIRLGRLRTSCLVFGGVLFLCSVALTTQAVTSAHAESSSDVPWSILEVPSSTDEITLKFTLYEAKDVQYFSAGVGIEERRAVYPQYPLKLILVQGIRAFLAEVNISITKSDGTPLVKIPSEHVMGPWVFINLPSGSYTISATDSNQRTIERKVRVEGTQTRVVHFRWPAL